MANKTTHPHVKFIHCRSTNDQGAILPHGGLTIAYVINENFKVVGWAAARCNPLDRYNKNVGRMKAAGRLKSDAFYTDCPEIDEPTFIKQSHDDYKEKFNAV